MDLGSARSEPAPRGVPREFARHTSSPVFSELRNEPLAQLVHVVAAVVVVKRVHLVSGCVEVADVVQGHLGGPEEVRPFRKFVDLVLANLPYHPLLLAPAERPSPPALGARARRAVGRRRGRGIFGFFGQDLDRLIRLLLRRLLEERGGGLRPTHGQRAGNDVIEAQLRRSDLGKPRDAPGERARHVAADRAEVERVQITAGAVPYHNQEVANARSLESVPNRRGQPVVDALAPFLKLASHGVHLHRCDEGGVSPALVETGATVRETRGKWHRLSVCGSKRQIARQPANQSAAFGKSESGPTRRFRVQRVIPHLFQSQRDHSFPIGLVLFQFFAKQRSNPAPYFSRHRRTTNSTLAGWLDLRSAEEPR